MQSLLHLIHLLFKVASLGPYFGQYDHFAKYAKEKIPYAIQRYENECKRLYGVLDGQLQNQAKRMGGEDKEFYLAGSDFSIADIAVYPSSCTPRSHPL